MDERERIAAADDPAAVCPACRGAAGRVTRRAKDAHRPGNSPIYTLCACPACGLVWQHPVPTRAELARAYAVDYAPYRPCWATPGWPPWKLLRTMTLWRRLRRLPPVGPGRRLLEVGCGAGDFLVAARRRGWSVAAVELVPEVAGRLREGAGLAVTPGELAPGLWPAASFDVAVLWDVLEHVPDPLETLRLVTAYLRPGGLALLSLPTSAAAHAGRWHGDDWVILDLPRHLWFVSGPALDRWLGAAGLERLAYDTPVLDTLWLYALSAGRHLAAAQGVGMLVRRALTLVGRAVPDAAGLARDALRGRGLQAFVLARRPVPRCVPEAGQAPSPARGDGGVVPPG